MSTDFLCGKFGFIELFQICTTFQRSVILSERSESKDLLRCGISLPERSLDKLGMTHPSDAY